MPYPLADTWSRIRHRPQACKTCTRFSFAEKADYRRTIGTLQLGDCEKKTVEKAQGGAPEDGNQAAQCLDPPCAFAASIGPQAATRIRSILRSGSAAPQSN